MLYFKNIQVNFDLIRIALASNVAERTEIFEFLHQHKEEIEDEAVLGVLDFLTRYPNRYDFLAKKFVKIQSIDFSSSPKPKKISYAVVASLVLIIGIGILFFQFYNTPDAVFVPDEMGLDNMLDEQFLESHWDDFNRYFQLENYSMALKALERLPKHTAIDSTMYFKGVTAFKLENYGLASQNFQKLLQHRQSIFFQDGEYFFALSLYKQGDTIRSQEVLNGIISQSNHPFDKEAKALLAQLSKSN
jgi:tetratricopeptide (TPR) repeat protein